MFNYSTFYTRAGRLTLGEMCVLASHFRGLLFTGILLILLGSIAFFFSLFTTFVTVVFVGGLLAVGGLAQIVHAFYVYQWRGFLVELILGVINGVAGVLMVVRPDIGALSLTLVIATFLIIGGLLRIIAALALGLEHWVWILVGGILSVVLGIVIVGQWPLSAFWVIGLFVSMDLIFSGWSLVAAALVARRLRSEALCSGIDNQ